MIAVTRLNGSRFAVNPDLIERVQENPDTTLVMVGGATYVVRESLPDVIALIADFRALVIAAAQSMSVGGVPQLSVLRGESDARESGSRSATGTGTAVTTPTPLRPTEH
ncbi:flagellar FlbD family protein [Terrabacter aerolatus]|nr:flagellar FlbD family protein [Terrabacter aerolatus]